MEIFQDVIQGSDEWHQLRLGRCTASQFKVLMVKTDEKKGRATYMLKLAGERLCGKPADSFVSEAMEHGKEVEPELRDHFAFVRDCEVRQVGFIRDGNCGASPDGLIEDDEVLEIKRAAPHILIPMLLKQKENPSYFPNEHFWQCQGNLMVSGRKRANLLVGYPGMPKPLIAHCDRDEASIAALRAAIDVFDLELRKLVEKFR